MTFIVDTRILGPKSHVPTNGSWSRPLRRSDQWLWRRPRRPTSEFVACLVRARGAGCSGFPWPIMGLDRADSGTRSDRHKVLEITGTIEAPDGSYERVSAEGNTYEDGGRHPWCAIAGDHDI